MKVFAFPPWQDLREIKNKHQTLPKKTKHGHIITWKLHLNNTNLFGNLQNLFVEVSEFSINRQLLYVTPKLS